MQANLSILGELSLEKVLQSIVGAARELVAARYAALGVIGDDGLLAEFVHVGMDDSVVSQIGPLPAGRGLLGALIHEPRTVRLERISEDLRSSGFPAGHPPMESFLGVPILVRGAVYGNLYLTDRLGGGAFSAEDEETIEAFSTSAGIAIENARLYEASTRRQQWAEVTSEVTAALLDPHHRSDPVRTVIEALARTTRADMATVAVPMPDPTVLRITHAVGLATGLEETDYPREGSIPDAALRSGRGIRLANRVEQQPYNRPLRRKLTVGPVLAVPMRASDRVYGVLSAGRRPGQPPFDAADLELAESFAGQAAVAMALMEARADQERLVVVQDRERIARDLHDHVIQRLFAAGLSLEGLAGAVDDERAAAGLDRVVDDLDVTIGQIRTLIFRLQSGEAPPSLRSMVLALADEAAGVLGFAPTVDFEGPVDTLADEELVQDLKAVVREALSNVARHARARRVEVRVQAFVERLTLRISDDGVGPGRKVRHSGLGNLEQRAARYGGTSEIVGVPTGGTEIRWSIALR